MWEFEYFIDLPRDPDDDLAFMDNVASAKHWFDTGEILTSLSNTWGESHDDFDEFVDAICKNIIAELICGEMKRESWRYHPQLLKKPKDNNIRYCMAMWCYRRNFVHGNFCLPEMVAKMAVENYSHFPPRDKLTGISAFGDTKRVFRL